MAVGKLKGKTSRQVAAEVGLHPVVVRRYWGGAESLNLQLKRKHAEQLGEAYGDTVSLAHKVVRRRLHTRKPDIQEDRLALSAGKLVLDFVTAGDPPLERVVPPPPPQPDGEVIRTTLEELLISYRRATTEVAKKTEESKTER
jgi:hypothetical protein